MSKTVHHHVVSLGNGWAVKSARSSRFTVITDNKEDAVTVAKQIAQANGATVVIHGRDGQVKERHRYGVDPPPPKK